MPISATPAALPTDKSEPPTPAVSVTKESQLDAAFGPGTRRSMAGWQGENGFETTGVLTARQRGALLGQYNAVLEDLGFETIMDDRAGITIDMPLEIVERREEASPFVRYEPGFFSASFFVGTEAGLDPDASWYQSEYAHDTPLVTMASDLPEFWIGSSGDIGPEN